VRRSQHPTRKHQRHPCKKQPQKRKPCPCMRRDLVLTRPLAREQQRQRQRQLWQQHRSARRQWRPLPLNDNAQRPNLGRHWHQGDVCLTGLWRTLTTMMSTSPASSAIRVLGRLHPNSLKSSWGAKTKTKLRRQRQKMGPSTPPWPRMIRHQPRPHQVQRRHCHHPHHLPRRRSILLVACPRRRPRTALRVGSGAEDLQAAIGASSGSLAMT